METFLRQRITSEKQGGGQRTDDDCSIFVNVELFGRESVEAKTNVTIQCRELLVVDKNPFYLFAPIKVQINKYYLFIKIIATQKSKISM